MQMRNRSFLSLIATISLVLLASQCSQKSSVKSADGEKQTANGTPRESSASSSKSVTARGTSRGTKTPDRDLPRLADGVERAVRGLLEEAKADYNRAIRENGKDKPDKALFFAALDSCKHKLDEADEKLEPVTLWEEESTMEDWKVTAEQDGYLRSVLPLIARIDKLRSAAEKISRAR